MIVNKGNIKSISYDEKLTKLTVVFMGTERKYEYRPVTQKEYDVLLDSALADGSDKFKASFKQIKDNPHVDYKEVR